MRILIVHPGATISVSDVHDGLSQELQKIPGVEVIYYALAGRMAICDIALKVAYKKSGKSQGLTKPTDADVIYMACQGIFERVLHFQPDWVIVVTSFYFVTEFVPLMQRCRAESGSRVKVAYLLTESPYDDDAQGRRIEDVDLVWTNERSSVGFLSQHTKRACYLPHAYNPMRQLVRPSLDLDDKGKPILVHRERGNVYIVEDDLLSHDVVFVGTDFEERIKLLEAVNWDGINLGLYGQWELLPARHKLRKYIVKEQIPNWITAELYHRAKIGLNLFRTSVGYGLNRPHIQYAESLGPRSLELAASGCFHLSERRKEVDEIFEGTVPTFDGPEELEAQVRYWLARPDEERAALAAQAKERVLARSFARMAAQVLNDLQSVG